MYRYILYTSLLYISQISLIGYVFFRLLFSEAVITLLEPFPIVEFGKHYFLLHIHIQCHVSICLRARMDFPAEGRRENHNQPRMPLVEPTYSATGQIERC